MPNSAGVMTGTLRPDPGGGGDALPCSSLARNACWTARNSPGSMPRVNVSRYWWRRACSAR